MRSVLLACLLAASAIAHGANDDIRVSAQGAGAAVRIEARALLHASPGLVWQTLTDYNHLGAFIPGMTTSRVVGRRGIAAIVEQTGTANFMFFSYPIDVTVSSEEYPPSSIRVHSLKGSLKRLEGGYGIAVREGGNVELTWSGLIEPDLPVPAFITTPLLRATIEAQFRGMVSEIRRRNAAGNP